MSCATLCAASQSPFASCQSAASVRGSCGGGADAEREAFSSASVIVMRAIIADDSMFSPGYDVGRALDEGRWTGYQKRLVALTALAIVFDGIDNQLLGIAIPELMGAWHAARAAFAPVVSLSLAGMMLGGAVAGIAGDRFGRRVLLLASMALFGASTLGIAAVNDVRALATLRFITGLGLGGAIPNATALAAEYVPRARRALAVTVTIVCVPLGASLAGLFAARALPVLGWRGLFAAGGI